MSKMKEKIGNLLLELDVNSHQATILKFISDADELIIPEKVVHKRQLFHITTIEKDSFVNCKLKKIFFPYSIQNLKEGWCNLIKNVNSIIVSPQNPILLNLDNKLLLSKSNLISNNYENILFAKKNIECIVIPSFIKKISSFCFSFCLKLKKNEFAEPSEIISIDDFTFSDSSIQNIVLPNSLQFIGIGWYKNTPKLKFVQVLEYNNNFVYANDEKNMIIQKKRKNQQNILIYNSNKIKQVFIPIHIKNINAFCFFHFKNLQTIIFDNSSEISLIEKFTFSESSIQSIILPKSITKIDEYVFSKCKKLQTITFDDFSELREIGKFAFSESSIQSIILPKSITKIDEYAFSKCKKLQTITFDDFSELREIGKFAFSESSIQSIIIPKKVIHIDETAFDNCSKLKTVDLPDNTSNLYFGKNIIFSKFKYIINLQDFRYGKIVQNAGILSFLCFYKDSLKDVIKELLLPKKYDLYVNFKKKFSENLTTFFDFFKNFDVYLLCPSIGMMCAYRIMEQKMLLNDLYIELLDKNNCSNFEFRFIQKYSQNNSILHSCNNHIILNGSKSLNNNNLKNEVVKYKKKYLDFFNYIEEINMVYPDEFKSVPLLKQLSVNNNLSLVFLCGKSFIEKPGIYSFHLHGTMSPCVRDFNTGFICFDEKSKSKFPENFENLIQHLLINNPLYKDIDEIKYNNIEFTRKLTNKVDASCALVIEPENEISKNPGSRWQNGKIYVGVSSKNDGETIQLPFEIAIASLFPFLFPNGPIDDIPGNSLRKKVRNLLLSHERYRCGPVAAHLILFCFDLIEKDENFYFQNFVKPKQFVQVPENYNRSIPTKAIIRKADPSFGLYWHIQLESINGYCEIFGNPDLKMTLTFGNNWPECSETLNEIMSRFNEFQDSNFDMVYCGVESMFIFEERLSKIKENKFEKWFKYCNLPKCSHFVCRLEFQNRGAPHVHILMWLEKRITLSDIQDHFYACNPPIESVFLKKIISSQMIHSCKYPRCFSGKDRTKCKYGFPKEAADETKYVDGSLVYQRTANETNIVEYNPALINEWGAHAHIHILRCDEVDIPNSDDSCYYVLKYNMKKEPNVTITVNNPDLTWHSLFKGRVVSLEEATARIFSFTFCQKDVVTKYINIQLPDKRKANFDNWKQKTYDDIEAYFLRPKIAEYFTILDFYSVFDLEYLKIDNSDVQSHTFTNNNISKKGRIESLFYKIHERTNQCIVTFPTFDYSTQREEFLYEYLILNNKFIEEPKINIGESYDKLLSQADFLKIGNEVKNAIRTAIIISSI